MNGGVIIIICLDSVVPSSFAFQNSVSAYTTLFRRILWYFPIHVHFPIFPIFSGRKWDRLKHVAMRLHSTGYKILRQLFDMLNIEVSITILPARVSCR